MTHYEIFFTNGESTLIDGRCGTEEAFYLTIWGENGVAGRFMLQNIAGYTTKNLDDETEEDLS